jgi:hypothetical protein
VVGASPLGRWPDAKTDKQTLQTLSVLNLVPQGQRLNTGGYVTNGQRVHGQPRAPARRLRVNEQRRMERPPRCRLLHPVAST